MNLLIKDTLDDNKLPDDFTSKIINDVRKPNIKFPANTDGLEVITFPQSLAFLSCFCVCLETLGEDYSYTVVPDDLRAGMPISNPHIPVRYNNLYALIAAYSGSAFVLTWNPGKWDVNNFDVMAVTPESLALIRRSFEVAGYRCEIFGNRDYYDGKTDGLDAFSRYEDYDFFRERIIHNIYKKNKPVIALGVLNVPPAFGRQAACLITGYDKTAEVLIGWSTQQDIIQKYDKELKFEPSGYFRQRDWFLNTRCLITVGEKCSKPPRDRLFRNTLEWAVTLAETERISGRKSGLAAYKAIADDILNDGFFIGSRNILYQRYNILTLTLSSLFYENRWYAAIFLKHIAEEMPELKKNLMQVADCFLVITSCAMQCYMALGGYKASYHSQAMRLADHDVRGKIASYILQARDKNAEAVELIKKALEKF